MDDFTSFLSESPAQLTLSTTEIDMPYFMDNGYEPDHTRIQDWDRLMSVLTKYVSKHRKLVRTHFMNDTLLHAFSAGDGCFWTKTQIRNYHERFHNVFPQKDMVSSIIKEWLSSKPSVKRFQMRDLVGWFYLTCCAKAKACKIGKEQDRCLALGLYFFFYPRDEDFRAPWSCDMIYIIQIAELLNKVDLRGFPELALIYEHYANMSDSFWDMVMKDTFSDLSQWYEKSFRHDREQRAMLKEFWKVIITSEVPRIAHKLGGTESNFMNSEPYHHDVSPSVLAVMYYKLTSSSTNQVQPREKKFFNLLSTHDEMLQRHCRPLNNQETIAWTMLSLMHSYGSCSSNGLISMVGPIEHMISALRKLEHLSPLFLYDPKIGSLIVTCRRRVEVLLDHMRDTRRTHLFGGFSDAACALSIKYGVTTVKAYFGPLQRLVERIPLNSKGCKFGTGGVVPPAVTDVVTTQQTGSLRFLMDLYWKHQMMKNLESEQERKGVSQP